MKLSIRQPMLATSEVVPIAELPKLRYPKLVSTKLDGFRCIIGTDGTPLMRSLDPVPNIHVRETIQTAGLPEGPDGEIGIVNDDGSLDFRGTTSALRKRKGTPNFRYFLFDNFMAPGGFRERNATLHQIGLPEFCTVLPQTLVTEASEITTLYEAALEEGNEGLIIRDPESVYKAGRATRREEWMLKMKPWEDAEAVILGVVQKRKNMNPKTTSARGYAKRGTSKENMIPVEAVGALLCYCTKFKEPFEIGGGWDAKTAAEWWKTPPLGQFIKFKYALAGGYDKPRHAEYLDFRARADMDKIEVAMLDKSFRDYRFTMSAAADEAKAEKEEWEV